MKRDSVNHPRRRFLKQAAAGLAGMATVPAALHRKQPPGGNGIARKLITRTLGKTGLQLPVVSMGVMNADNPKLVEAALNSGIRHLDTAWYYQFGRNETMIGEVIKDRDRDSLIIATKIWEPREHDTGLFPGNATSATFLEKFETSLKRLGLEYVDILYLHNISNPQSALFEPYLQAMQLFKRQGRARFLGLSTHANEAPVIRAAVDSGVYEVVLTAYNFRKENLPELSAAIDHAAQAGLGIVAMKTQAGIYWDGREKQEPINMKAALKWALQNSNIHTAVPGFTTFDQLELDISVMEDLMLTSQEKRDLRLEETVAGGFYCQQCGVCRGQCAGALDIPTLMRSYMYAFAYRNSALAKQTLAETDRSTWRCADCRACTVRCRMGFDIRQRVMDIIRLDTVPVDFLT